MWHGISLVKVNVLNSVSLLVVRASQILLISMASS